jgi:hypothetical protein
MKNSVKKETVNKVKKSVNLVNVNVKFIQGNAELNLMQKEIELTNIKQLAETLSIKILTARANMKRYNKKIKGFNFNRKFTIELTVNKNTVCLDDLFGNLDNFTTTLATTEKHFYNFASLIYDLLFMATNGGDKLTVAQILSKQNVLLLA